MRRLWWVVMVLVVAACDGGAFAPLPPTPCTIATAHTVDTLGWVTHLDGRPPSPITAHYCGGARPAR